MMRRGLTSLALVAALSVALVACGGGDDDAGGDAAPTTVAGATFSGRGSERFCGLARSNADRINRIGAAVGNPGELRTLLRDAQPVVRDAADAAPAEIKKDAEVLADAFQQLLDSLERGSPNFSALTDPEFQTASERLTRYGREVCGITG